ncbi:MAG: hypothetical protein M3295_08035 [Chloroflexota bacterium]|nr:hypothetical protein [Chloroflexota bacterium]
MPAAPPARSRAVAPVLLAAALAAAGCSTLLDLSDSPTASPTSIASPAPTAVPSPSPTPTPPPTPTYTNLPDAELRAVIPDAVGGMPVEKPDAVALTPGDVGEVFGPVGKRFRSLVVAFTEEPRLTLFAMRVDPPPVTTRRLRPYLGAIGQYVGIEKPDADAWSLVEIGDKTVWTRGDDPATLVGTQIYTWVADDLVFLMVGTDEAHNTAMLAALPG